MNFPCFFKIFLVFQVTFSSVLTLLSIGVVDHVVFSVPYPFASNSQVEED